MPFSERALHVAATKVGVQESPRGSNSGPWVDKFLKSVDLGPGYPWCAAFAEWCYEEAGCPERTLPDSGLVADWKRYGKARGWLMKSPSRGRLFIIDNGDGTGHIGFITGVLPDGSFSTIEGNTNPGGSREGYGVFRRGREHTRKTFYLDMSRLGE